MADFIKLSDVVISNEFAKTIPSAEKLNAVRSYVLDHGTIDSPISISQHNHVLVDGYIRYLVAKEVGLEYIPYKTVRRRVRCVIGRFEGNDKNYKWRLPNDLTVNIGMRVAVESKCPDGQNTAVITVDKIITMPERNAMKHKYVIGIANPI